MTTETDSRRPRPARGPVRGAERALAPDLARGAMLLFIALANSAVQAFGGQPGAEEAPHGWERPYNVFMFVFVHARAYPMFAVMFGYGLVQLARRQDAAGAGPGAARAVLLRRSGWLIAFGFVHAALLNFGDFLGAYGIVGILFTLILLRRGDRVHRIVLWIWGLTTVYTLALAGVAAYRLAHTTHLPHGGARVPQAGVDSLTASGYGASVLDRLGEWPVHTITVIPFLVIVWLGAWAARHRVLEDPARHRRLLVRTAAAALPLALLGGLPLGLVSGGFLHVDAATADVFLLLYEVSGQFGGPGYVALFGLIALALTRAGRTRRAPAVAGALTALGRRSLSGYLFQSLAWVVLLSPYALALGERTGSPTGAAAGCALLVWLVTVLGAYALERRSLPGPAEKLLRRLTYGRAARTDAGGGRPDGPPPTAVLPGHGRAPDRLAGPGAGAPDSQARRGG